MQSQREQGTKPEIDLRKALHARGLRFRLHQPVVPGTTRCVDIVFHPVKIAVDVRGCFWHGCPLHATQPKKNAEWWAEKLESNIARDIDTSRRLKEAGWTLVIVWEHENLQAAAARLDTLIRTRRSG